MQLLAEWQVVAIHCTEIVFVSTGILLALDQWFDAFREIGLVELNPSCLL